MGTAGSGSIKLLTKESLALDGAFGVLRQERGAVLTTHVVTAALRVAQQPYAIEPLLVEWWAARYPSLGGIGTLLAPADRYAITLTRDGNKPVGALLPSYVKRGVTVPAVVAAVVGHDAYMASFAASFAGQLADLPPVW